MKKAYIFLILIAIVTSKSCYPCYSQSLDKECPMKDNIQSHTLHMSVHPHLDAFWIFDFQSYYNPKRTDGGVLGYFRSNRFNSVKQIFDTITKVLKQSKDFRQAGNYDSQKAHRSFFNSEMGFFKRWYYQQDQLTKNTVKQLLKTKYWQIMGGAYVQHDQGCAYYEDIIQNFELGLHFLKQQFNYQPKAAVSADSFGHSQSTLAILAHIGIEGYFVERSDQHILKQNKTQFIWKAKSSNGNYYGALPTHIRWAIHGFQDQFIPGGSDSEVICQTKSRYIKNMQQENQFLKNILKSSHIMRYFGHDFQRFDEHSYYVMQGIMQEFSKERCNRVSAVYGNPTQYFMTLMGQVFGKVKPIATRSEDIMPIWDYDSGLYWTGYYTTDPFHKKGYRDAGRYLHAIRKGFLPAYIQDPYSSDHKNMYKILEELAQIVSYLQHHDGISGTSKYSVMDQYQQMAQNKIKQVKKTVEPQLFKNQFQGQLNNKTFECNLQNECTIPESASGDIYIKVFNSGGSSRNFPIIVHLSENQNYQPLNCDYYEINCLCTGFPCPCSLYIFTKIPTYSVIKLKKSQSRSKDANLMLQIQNQNQGMSFNDTHFTLQYNSNKYSIGYKSLNGDSTPRRYKHLTRYGTESERTFNIRSGKYALGNDIKTQKNLSKIRKVYRLQSDYLKKYVIIWARQQMKTVITITNEKFNQWKVQTYSAAEAGKLQDLYLEVSAPHIQNDNKFYTDSNGWLVMKRELHKHQDYQAFFSKQGYDQIDGNSYPMTAFCYLQDVNNPKNKLSINTDRPQGAISYHPGTLWVNFDRLSADDGKWVYQTTLRNQYQKFTHFITVENDDNNQRVLQRLYDQPILMEGHESNKQVDIAVIDKQKRQDRIKWSVLTGLGKVKVSIRPWNDTSVTVRLHNLNDQNQVNALIFQAKDKISPILSAYYGNMVHYDTIEQTNLGSNLAYSQFVNKKWNWDEVVNLNEQNKIFRKQFSQQITLRPLQIRTFLFTNIKFGQQCKNIDQITYSNQGTIYDLDINKPMPRRSREQRSNQQRINKYLLEGDHCSDPSPVLKNGSSISLSQKTINVQEQEQHKIDINKIEQPDPLKNLQIQEQNPQIIEKPENQFNAPDFTFDEPTTTTKQKPIDSNVNNNINRNSQSGYSQIRVKVKNRQQLTKLQKQTYFMQVLKSIKK